ncbi:site-2 protease family protein [Sphingorhabdus sp. Alg239-R122]|uniref:site-2 protease family protein n=1 Tax=Sphingorhabdus sp. Alg239-R122 TaxID=2305989 RepID=UPI0013DAE4A3|nr:site-2 protease family protein [Sphingorhabdus sp. Alg239-R122]
MDDTNIIYTVATWLIPLMLAIVFHEVAHGWVARYFGDPTAASLGRLTLNPIKHVDPIGTVALPTLLAVTGAPIFGWAKPVPVVQSRLRNPRWHMMAVAFAGPGINLILGFFAVAAMALMVNIMGEGADFGTVSGFIFDNLRNFMIINIFLALFNLLPVPPFDGSHIVEGILPPPLAEKYASLRKYSLPILLLLLLVLPMVFPEARIIERVILPPVVFVINFYLGIFGLNV